MNRGSLRPLTTKNDSTGHLWLNIKDPLAGADPMLSGSSPLKSVMRVMKIRWKAFVALFVIFLVIFALYYNRADPEPCPKHDLSHEHLSKVAYYCNPVDKGAETGHEGSLPTDLYDLEQVHIVIRHGDRYRLHSLPNHVMPTISCDMDTFPEIEDHVPEVRGYVESMKANTLKLQGKDDLFTKFSLYPNAGRCEDGHLTPYGAAQHIRNGAFLRKAYVDKWTLIGSETQKQVHMISTVRQRTFQSALAFLYGLLPSLDMNNIPVRSVPDARMCANSYKTFPCHCYAIQRFIDLADGGLGQTGAAFTSQKHVADAYKDLAQALQIPQKDLPRATAVMDVAMVSACHTLTLPGQRSTCMKPESVRHIVEAINDNGWKVQNHTLLKRIVRLRMLPLLHDVMRSMETHLQGGQAGPRLVLHSGHDSTIGPLIGALNVSTGAWPQYAARFVFELYSTKPTAGVEIKKQYFVRFLYNGKDVTQKVLFCQGKTKPDFHDLCPFENYQEFISNKDGLADLKDSKISKYVDACSQAIVLS